MNFTFDYFIEYFYYLIWVVVGFVVLVLGDHIQQTVIFQTKLANHLNLIWILLCLALCFTCFYILFVQLWNLFFINHVYLFALLIWSLVIVIHIVSHILIYVNFIADYYPLINHDIFDFINYFKNFSFDANNTISDPKIKELIGFEHFHNCCGFYGVNDYQPNNSRIDDKVFYPSSCCALKEYTVCESKQLKSIASCKVALCNLILKNIFHLSSLMTFLTIIDIFLIFNYLKFYYFYKYNKIIVDHDLSFIFTKVKRINIGLNDLISYHKLNKNIDQPNSQKKALENYNSLLQEVIVLKQELKQIYILIRTEPEYHRLIRKDYFLSNLVDKVGYLEDRISKLKKDLNDEMMHGFRLSRPDLP